MKITKKLKYTTFEWDDEQKEFALSDNDGNELTLNKVYSFAFMRFVIRMAQRNWFKKVVKEIETPEDALPTLDEEIVMQLAFSLEDANEDCSELPEEKLTELLAGVRNEFHRNDEDLPF